MKKFIIFLGLLFLIQNVIATDISACTILTTGGSPYYLTQDVLSYDNCMIFNGDNIILDCQDFHVEGLVASGDEGIVFNGDNNIIKNCNITDWQHNIWFNDSHDNLVLNCKIGLSQASLPSIWIDGISTGNNISNCEINDIGMGIKIYNDSNIIEHTTINVVHNGISVFGSHNLIQNCSINSGRAGIYFANNRVNNSIIGCNISNSGYDSSHSGIYLESSVNGTLIKDCSICNSDKYGIHFQRNIKNNIITGCVIQNNTLGGINLYLQAGEYPINNSFYNNFFSNDAGNLVSNLVSFENFWNTTKQDGLRIYSSGSQIGGNYWSNSTNDGYSDICVDSDNNGFCDNAYNISGTQSFDYLPYSDEYIQIYPPIIDSIHPQNNSDIVPSIQIILEANISDVDSERINVTIWYDNRDGSCSYYNRLPNASFICEWSENFLLNVSYNWSVEVTDGIHDIHEYYIFHSNVTIDEVYITGEVGGMDLFGFCNALSEAAVYLYNYNTSHSYTTYTDINGAYVFPNIELGDYYIKVSKEGYIDDISNHTYIYGIYNYEDYCLFLKGHNSSWIINVYAYDESATMLPLTNYSLFLYDIYDLNHVTMENNFFNRCTFNCSKSDNQVIIDNMPNSYYTIYVTHDGFIDYDYLDEYGYHHFMDANYTSYVVLKNLSQIEGCNVSGYVISALDDTFLKDVKVQLYEHDFYQGDIAFTNSSGYYCFTNISEGYIDLDFKGNFIGYEDVRGYNHAYHKCDDTQYNYTLNVTYETSTYNGQIRNCENIYVNIQGVKIELIKLYTNISIRTAYSDFLGHFSIYNYPSEPFAGYFLRFTHNFYQTKEIVINYDHFNPNIREVDCLNPKCALYNIMFIVTYNNESISEDKEVYLLLEALELSGDCDFSSMLYTVSGERPLIFLPYGKYKVSAGFVEGVYTNNVIFTANEDKIVYIDITDSVLGTIGIPFDEASFWNWISKWGWFLFFLIFILFILVILKTQYNELIK